MITGDIMKIMTLYIDCYEFISVESAPKKVVQILFDGKAKGDYFIGRVLPGGVDTQIINEDGSGQLNAKYILEGYDRSGKLCRIYVDNKAELNSSETWPSIITDSEELKWLETAKLYGTIDTSDGVVIEIFADEVE